MKASSLILLLGFLAFCFLMAEMASKRDRTVTSIKNSVQEAPEFVLGESEDPLAPLSVSATGVGLENKKFSLRVTPNGADVATNFINLVFDQTIVEQTLEDGVIRFKSLRGRGTLVVYATREASEKIVWAMRLPNTGERYQANPLAIQMELDKL